MITLKTLHCLFVFDPFQISCVEFLFFFRLKVYGYVCMRDKRERDRKGINSGNIKMESEKELKRTMAREPHRKRVREGEREKERE